MHTTSPAFDEVAREIQRRLGIEAELRDKDRELAETRAARIAAEIRVERAAGMATLVAALSRARGVAEAIQAAEAHVPAMLGAPAARLRIHLTGGVPDGDEGSAPTEPPSEDRDRSGVTRLALPLRVGDGTLGAMILTLPGPRGLPEADRVLAREVADRCAEALDRTLAWAIAERAVARMTRLQRVTAAFSEALTPDDVAEVVVTQGCAALGAAWGQIGLLVERGGEIALLRRGSCVGDEAPASGRIPMSQSLPLTDAARSGSPLFFESTDALRACYPALAIPLTSGERAAATVPLQVRGRTLGAMGFAFDHARRFDADDRAFMVDLGRRCALALERTRLYEVSTRARADAEEAMRAKDEFLSTVSHELRTPLTAILGWTSMLRGERLGPEATARALSVIERNARTQVQLIEDILDVSRMATGKLRLEIRAVDPAAIVRAVVDGARPLAEAQGISVEATVDGGVGIVVADPGRLQQIVGNLFSNALKFTPRGGRIEVRLDRRVEGVRLRVSDSGTGIDAAFLPHVFERFRQAEAGNSRAHGGLGLGLAIVKHLVELHDGTITAESAGPGRGASFTVTLPLPPGDAANLDDSTIGAQAPPRLDGVRVLIVDDNGDAREMIATVLRGQGAIAIVAANADEGLRAVERERPDVLVSDIGMPDEDGYALLRRVRALASVPALALTAHAGTQDARMAELAGFEEYLAKPVTPVRLIAAVARLAPPPAADRSAPASRRAPWPARS